MTILQTTVAALIVAVLVATPARAQSSGSVTVTINLTIAATATVDVAKVQAQTKSAIRGLLSQRANMLTTSGPDTWRIHARLSGGSLFGGGEEVSAGFAADDKRSAGLLAGRRSPGLGGNGIGVADGVLDGPSAVGTLSRFGRQDMRGHRRTAGGVSSDSFGAGLRFEHDDVSDPVRQPAALPFSFTGNAEGATGRFAFATSLSQFRAAAEAKEREKAAALSGDSGAMGLGLAGIGRDARSRPAAFDLWLEGTSAHFASERPDGKRTGHASVLMFGADYIVRPGLLVGLMAQFDWMADSAKGTLLESSEGRGWMAGPYLGARLTPNLYLDVRALWGRSTNEIDPTGAFVDTFATTRALAAAKLTGDWTWGRLRFRPSAEIVYFTETQDDYSNAIGIYIARNTFELGRAIVGPEIGTSIMLGDGTSLEPMLGFKGVWDFARTDETTAAGVPVSPDTLRGRIEAGISMRLPSGVFLGASGAYDGIGAGDYRAIQGRAQLRVPLQ